MSVLFHAIQFCSATVKVTVLAQVQILSSIRKIICFIIYSKTNSIIRKKTDVWWNCNSLKKKKKRKQNGNRKTWNVEYKLWIIFHTGYAIVDILRCTCWKNKEHLHVTSCLDSVHGSKNQDISSMLYFANDQNETAEQYIRLYSTSFCVCVLHPTKEMHHRNKKQPATET